MATMLFQGHGSYRFTLDDNTVIYVDPYFGKEYELEADLILVTHDPEMASYADRIVTLIDGEIVSNQVNNKERTHHEI